MSLYWASGRCRWIAHKLDRLCDLTCDKTEPGELVHYLRDRLAETTGYRMPDESLDLLLRFNEAKHRIKDKHPASAESYLICRLQTALPLDIKRRLVEELESEAGIEPAA